MRLIAALTAAPLVLGATHTPAHTSTRATTAGTSAAAIRRADLDGDVREAITRFQKTDPGMATFFDHSAGYVVFPGIAKGAIGIGAAHGDGQLFEGGREIGHASMTQATIGLQLGGQVYSEIIFFETPDALASFKDNKFDFSAEVSAVALKSGASANAKYTKGVAVFTQAKGGLMYEASIGGQKFTYTPNGAN
jgi:lipid-binding SYLF domain-containing protein